MYQTAQVSDAGPQILSQELLQANGYNAWTKSSRKGKSKYKLLGHMMHLGRVDLEANNGDVKLRAAAPEIMQGIEQFLRRYNPDIPSAPDAGKPTLTRRLAQRFAPHKLEGLPELIESKLVEIYSVLPEDGQRFRTQVYSLCKNITERANRGESGQDITQKLMQEVKRLLHQ
jgi:hypothetical protein